MVTVNSLTAFCLILSTSSIAVNSRSVVLPPVDGGQLLMGKSLASFDTRDQALATMAMLGGLLPFEEVKGKKITEEGEKTVDGNDNLWMGTLVDEFDTHPLAVELPAGFESVRGKMLSEDVKSGSYVANPAKVLGEILANGGDMPEVMDGEIIAGDAAEVDVLTNLQQ